MTAPQIITLDHPVSDPVSNPVGHPVGLDQPNSLEQPSGRVPARTASASGRGPATGVGRWARLAALTGRSVLDDVSGSVDTVLTPTVPQAAATYLLFLTR
jgi:hypothetical protein